MIPIRRTRQAEADLLEIWLYLTRDNVDRADALLDRLDERSQILSQHPEAGRKRDELAPGIRSLTAGEYLIFYRVTDVQVEILRVLHGARNLPRIFQEGME